MAEALGQVGRVAEGLAMVGRGIDRSPGSWLVPELLRVKGELLLARDTADAAEAVEKVFRQALDGAREHGVLSWELRAATSLARLLRDHELPGDAAACLQPVYERFTEGFATADLVAAKQLLDDLAVRELADGRPMTGHVAGP